MAPQSSTTTATVEAPADASKLEAKASKSLGRLDSSESFDPATYGIDDKLSYATISERLKKSCMSEFSVAEQKVRIELAAAYRLFAKFDWNESVYNHLSCKIEEEDGSHSFLINAYGLRYDEITASSLLKIDYDGNLLHPGVVGDLFGVNKAGFVIHSAIHKARPDAVAVMHSHQALATGISATKAGFLEALSQTSELLGPMAYHEYEGIVVDSEESVRLIANMGDSNVMLMRNHGTVTLGETVAGAWYRMYVLIRACEIQLAAQTAATGEASNITVPPDEVVKKTFEIAKSFSGMSMGRLEFAAYMRLMDKEDPSFRV